MRIKVKSLQPEIEVVTSKSSGPGGQNVNKVNTKITLRFDVANSRLLRDDQKQIILKKLENKISNDGILIVSAGNKRSQLQNKEVAFHKLEKLIAKAFSVKKKRKSTKPTKASKQKRLNNKKQHAEKKKWRRKV